MQRMSIGRHCKDPMRILLLARDWDQIRSDGHAGQKSKDAKDCFGHLFQDTIDETRHKPEKLDDAMAFSKSKTITHSLTPDPMQ